MIRSSASPELITRLFVLLTVSSFPSTLLAAPPSVTRVSPLGIAPGQTSELTLSGSQLAGVTQLWSTWGAAIAPTKAEDGSLQFAVELPQDAPLGLHAVRVISPEGVSDLQLMVIDDLSSVAEASGNNTPDSAQSINTPCAVDGNVDNLSRDFFQFEASANQRLSFELLARRLGSPLDPSLILYDAKGHELAYADDSEGLSGDCQLCHTFKTAGTYIIELRDIRYAGSGGHYYRLRIGDFPCLNVPVPMGVQRGTQTRVDFAGMSADDANPDIITVPQDWPHAWYPVSSRRADGTASGFSFVAVSDTVEFLEREPNNTGPQANSVTLGMGLNGRFEEPGDVDRFTFEATNGQHFVFQGVTRKEASPADLILELYDAAGKQIGRVDDAGKLEGSLDHTFSADGTYTLAVSDLSRHGGPQYAYRVDVQSYQAGFDLAASADHVNIPAGGVGEVTVNVTRRGHNGPINLSLEGLPEGWTALPTIVGSGMNSGVLTVQAPADAATAHVLDNVTVVGTAIIGDTDVRVTATLNDALSARWNQVSVIPKNVSLAFTAAVAPKPAFSLTVEPAEVILGQHLKTTVKVLAQRGEGVDGAIELAAILDKTAFPPEASVKVQPIPAGANEVALEVTAGAKTPKGPFTVVLKGTHKKDKATDTAIAAPINYRIEDQLTMTVDPGERLLKREGELRVKVDVTRNPALGGGIKLVAEKLPTGVTAAEVVIPADQSTGELVLTATTDAAAGEFADVVVKATAVDVEQVTLSTPLGKMNIE
ncbi:MAG: PPC domain-containing protein [Planctomycetaceae bacterium]|nr:PPC domain-containing protein [Planctomycetaceae bacterium]